MEKDNKPLKGTKEAWFDLLVAVGIMILAMLIVQLLKEGSVHLL
jgi:hypothetical protein